MQLARPFMPGSNRNKKTTNVPAESEQMTIATCCNPIPGDEVIGFHKGNNTVEVHKKSCPEAIRMSSQYGERIIKASWGSEKVVSYLAVLDLRGIDRLGIVLEIARVISEQFGINIRALEFASHDGIFEGKISLYVRSNEDLRHIIDRLSSVKGVEKVIRREIERTT